MKSARQASGAGRRGAAGAVLEVAPGRETTWWLRRRARRFRYGWGTFKMDWALSGPVPWTVPEARASAVVHAGDSIDDLRRFTRQVRAGQLPDNPYLVIGQQIARRSEPRSGRLPHPLGLFARPLGRRGRLAAAARSIRRPDRATHRGVGAGVSRPDPGPAHRRAGRPGAHGREPCRRRPGRRQRVDRPAVVLCGRPSRTSAIAPASAGYTWLPHRRIPAPASTALAASMRPTRHCAMRESEPAAPARVTLAGAAGSNQDQCICPCSPRMAAARLASATLSKAA